MTIRILVNGAHGKMGQMAVKTLSNHAAFTVVGQTGREHNLAQEIKTSNADVVVDLTNAEAVWHNAITIIESGAHPVIGTSGLVENQVHELKARCAKLKLGGIIAPNFSIAVVLMMKHAQEVAKYYSQVEIIEMHHDGKLDSPSGTAVRTAEMLATARKSLPPVRITFETIPGARGANYQNIPIHAIRLPGLVAHQQIIFGGTGETLTLRHDSIDRQCFMPGIILSCQKVMMMKELVYGLEHVLD